MPDVGTISDYFNVYYLDVLCTTPNVKTFSGETSTIDIAAPMSTATTFVWTFTPHAYCAGQLTAVNPRVANDNNGIVSYSEVRDGTTGVITLTWTITDSNSLTTSISNDVSGTGIRIYAELKDATDAIVSDLSRERRINYTNKCQTSTFITTGIADPLVSMTINAPTTDV